MGARTLPNVAISHPPITPPNRQTVWDVTRVTVMFGMLTSEWADMLKRRYNHTTNAHALRLV